MNGALFGEWRGGGLDLPRAFPGKPKYIGPDCKFKESLCALFISGLGLILILVYFPLEPTLKISDLPRAFPGLPE